MLRRVLFGRGVSGTRFHFTGSIFGLDGLPRSANTSCEELDKNYRITGNNKGNMIIGNSVQKMFELVRNRSAHTNLGALYKSMRNRDKFSKSIKENFDCVVFPMANFIRPEVDCSLEAEALEALEGVDIFGFGAGMQREIDSIDQLPSGTIKLLRILDEKAKVFGVRGEKTRQFLAANGINNAVTLGCPSMYLYPENIINLKEVVSHEVKDIISAGYLSIPGRLARLSKPFRNKNFKVDYVIQGQISNFSTEQVYFNDATGEYDSEIIKKSLENKVPNIPFRKYYHFNSVDAWTHCCSKYDLYIGDRLHGGIAALQAGIPAIILYHDLRVQELTDFWGIPSISLKDFSEVSIDELINEKLSSAALNRFKSQYISKLAKFTQVVESHGLKLANKNIHNLIESYEQAKRHQAA